MVIAAGVGAAAAVGGAAISASSAGSAADKQQASTSAALAQQAAQTGYQNQQSLPYIAAGDNAETRQQDLLDNYNGTVQPYLNNLGGFNSATALNPYLNTLTNLGNGATAQQTLANTPGYQFTLQQGLQSTQNAAAARGLGVSGAALKGAASYATGLADQTYQQQYGNALSNLNAATGVYNTGYNSALSSYNAAANNFNNQFSANNSLATTGANVNVQQGSQNQSAAANNSSLLTNNGNAQAASTIAQGNALSGIGTGVSNSLSTYNQGQLLQALTNQQLNNNGGQYTGSGQNALAGSGYQNLTTQASNYLSGLFS